MVYSTAGNNNFELNEEWTKAYSGQDVVIPFWCFFVIQEDSQKRISLNFTLSAPAYKLHDGDVKAILKRLTEMSEQLALKVKKLVFLKEVSATCKFPRELRLAEKLPNQNLCLPKETTTTTTSSSAVDSTIQDTPDVPKAKPKPNTSKFIQKMKKFAGDQSSTSTN